ncbi:MAG: GGDEF domain-containing protein [Methyloligellaceae bacterium]
MTETTATQARATPPSEVHDFQRTMIIGERAIGYLKEFRTPAIPRNYEIFYIHSAGYNKELSEEIRKAIAKHSCLTEEDAERLYLKYIQPEQYAEQVGNVSSQVAGEISDIMAAIASACQRTGSFGTSLEGIKDQLGLVQTPAQLKIVVKKLVLTTNDMAEYNRNLERRLAESKRQIEELHQNLETIRAESLTDQLTSLSNRKRFDQILEMEMTEAEGSQEPLCLLMMDIDHFKHFNDTYGHQTGDQVLRLVAHTLKTNVKGRDSAARYGGEEFAVILPKTNLRSAIAVAESIRKSIKAKELIKKSTGQSLGYITMSIGVAAYRIGESAAELISRADKCLYAAKRAGRDCVKSDADRIDQENKAAGVDAA